MLLLALDSADATCSAAVWDGARPEPGACSGIVAWRPVAARPSSWCPCRRPPARPRARLGALDALAVGHGPGSFTGIRSAVAAARGLALAAALPVLGVGTLEALAAAVPDAEGTLVAAIDARRGQVYAQIFDGHRRALGRARAADPGAGGRRPAGRAARLVGSGAALIRAALPASRRPWP